MLKRIKKLICLGKSIKYRIAPYDPLRWLISDTNKLSVFSIDGFIVDKNKKVTALFQKFEYEQENDKYKFRIEDLYRIYPEEIFKSIIKLSLILKCDYRIFIWSDKYNPDEDRTLLDKAFIQMISLGLKGEKIITHAVEKISINDLEKLIFDYRKMSFEFVKPLNTGTSSVGCYLSNSTKNPWPGDVDGFIFNPITNQVIFILEFKTHNINTLTEDEHVGKYGAQDWRRFDVLYSLQRCLKDRTNHEPKLLYIAWGTGDFENHKNIKVDEIKDNKIITTQIFPRPKFDTYSSDLYNSIIKL